MAGKKHCRRTKPISGPYNIKNNSRMVKLTPRNHTEKNLGITNRRQGHVKMADTGSDAVRLPLENPGIGSDREMDSESEDESNALFNSPPDYDAPLWREDTMTKNMKDIRKRRVDSSELYRDISEDQWPIVYSSQYNIGFFGLQKLHPFDSGKWGRICDYLTRNDFLKLLSNQLVEPSQATEDDLLVVHSKEYLDSLQNISTVAEITEILPLVLLPRMFHWLVQSKVLRPLQHQTGGTVLAAKLALERGWAINLGGGFHHCSSESGGGFCVYADIAIALTFLFEKQLIQKAMILDLDAHQGNGHERDFMDDPRVYIMDVYNTDIYPRDNYAKGAIQRKVEFHSGTKDEEYLKRVEEELEMALNGPDKVEPDIIIYNAGTDILEGDPLGRMNITAKGIVSRDELVFRKAHSKGIPVAMVTSGGYQRRTAEVVADSIVNLHRKKLIKGPDLAQEQSSESSSYCTVQ